MDTNLIKARNLIKQCHPRNESSHFEAGKRVDTPKRLTIDGDQALKLSIDKNHIPLNTRKQDRLCNSLHLSEILYAHCCPQQCIAKHLKETPTAIQEHLKLWSGLPQDLLSEELAKVLDSCQVEHATEKSVKIQGNYYNLKWHGVSLCRTAFQLLYGVSRRKLISACGGSYLQPHGNTLIYHENSLTLDILNFLDDLKARCGNQCDSDPTKDYLNGFYEKKQVWKHYIDSRSGNEDVASDSHFYAVWSHHRPNLVVENDAMKCATCTKLDILMKSASEEEIVSLKADKLRHKQVKKVHLDRMHSLMARAKRGQFLLLIGDHMRSKGIPKLKRNNMNILMSELINIHFSGWFNPYSGKSKYYLFPEHWSESANSIISCLHALLKELNSPQRKLVLVFDNHSTQHNNALLAYCDWLVRFNGTFDEIEILFLIAGHTKNKQDQMNSYVAGEYMKRQFFSISDLCTLGNDKREFQEQQHILQWVKKFAPLINEYPNVSKAHLFLFTREGLTTKEFVDDLEWNSWNYQDPMSHHHMLLSKPVGVLEPMQPYKLSDKKKHDAKASLAYIPIEHRDYISKLLVNDFGYQIQAVDAFGELGMATRPIAPPMPRSIVFREKRKRGQQQPSKAQHPNATALYSEDTLEPGELDDILQSAPPGEYYDSAEEQCQAKKKHKSTQN